MGASERAHGAYCWTWAPPIACACSTFYRLTRTFIMFRYMTNFRDAAALLAVLGTVAFVPAVFAADDNESGPYLGGGYGQFDTSVDDVEELGEAIDELDTDDSAWKVFFGWRFNKFISLELDYIDLGSPR